MKNMMKLTMISSFVAMGLAAANAQDTNANAAVVLQVNFALTGFKQSGDAATSVRISNKDIFTALNASSNGMAFGRTARLVVVQDLNSGSLSFQVRERNGTNDVITDISGTGTLTVTTSDNVVTGKNVEYTILTFTFTDNNGNDFSVSGFATLRKGRVTGRGLGPFDNVRVGAAVQVSGTGHVGGEDTVLHGTINAGGPRAEALQ